MSDTPTKMTDLERAKYDWIRQHLQTYLSSGGAKGHILDQRDVGAHNFCTTLILKTVGRKSGAVRMVPLVYGQYGGEVVIVASKAGADVHPAWYLNILDAEELEFQIGAQAFRASWRSPGGQEREDVFAYMTNIFPPYEEYQRGTSRKIPLVMLKRIEEIAPFKLEA